MSLRTLVAILLFVFVHSVGSWAQKQAGTVSVTGVQEFPVVFQSSITSGKTQSGTKIQARLSIATLLNGIVVPRNAEFSGEVVVSQARTRNEPSRLSVRMDSVSWKNGSVPVKVFLTQWFYTSIAGNLSPLQSGPVLWNDTVTPPPTVPNKAISPHREKMKNVGIERASDGTVMLVCEQHSVKIDRSTTYVLTTGDLATSLK